jgi:CRP-like cAMP-binding protein
MLRRFSKQNRSQGGQARVTRGQHDPRHLRQVDSGTAHFEQARATEFEFGSISGADRRDSDAQASALAEAPIHVGSKLSPDLGPFITKLSVHMALPVPDQHAILAAALPPRQVGKQEHILKNGEPTRSLLFLCTGSARAYRSFEDGSQQIVSVLLPGDALNPGDLVLRRSRIAVCAITPSVVIEIPLRDLLSLMASSPHIMRALWIENAMQAAIQRERMIWLGRRNAVTRLAHFLCEVTYRMQIGRDEEFFQFPLTQRDLADTLGLSTIHVNRVLKLLRNKQLIDIRQNQLNVLDWERLCAIAEFDPGYLNTPGAISAEDALDVSESKRTCEDPHS